MATIWETREGEDDPVQFTLKTGTTADNLTSVSSISFILNDNDGTETTAGTVAVKTAASGVIEYTPTAGGDVTNADEPYRAYFKVTMTGGTIRKYPNSEDLIVRVLPEYEA